jgi:hypothetical protein
MKRVAIQLLLSVVVLACARTVSAQTVDEVLDKSISALGGRAAFAKVKSRRTTGSITLATPAGDVAGTIEVTNAAPNKVRTVIKADLTSLGAGPLVIDQRFDGTQGYVLDSLQGNRDITGDQLATMRNGGFPHPFLTYKEQGIAAKLTGKEPVNGRDAYVVVFEPPSGSTVRQYIDATTYLPVRSVVKVSVPQLGQDIEQISDASDFRDVDGLKVPFMLKVSSTVQNYTVAVTTVEHNVAVEDSIFIKP